METKKYIDDNEIFKAGLSEFSRKSFDDASLNTIIKNARISKGSFYYRYKTKYDLYIHILKTCLKEKWEYIRKQIDHHPAAKTRGDIFDLFSMQAKVSIDFACTYPEYHELGVMFAKEKGTQLYNNAIKDLSIHDGPGIGQMVAAALDNNEFNKRFSKDFIEKMITHLFSSFYEVFLENNEHDIKTLYKHLDDYIEFMRSGLASH